MRKWKFSSLKFPCWLRVFFKRKKSERKIQLVMEKEPRLDWETCLSSSLIDSSNETELNRWDFEIDGNYLLDRFSFCFLPGQARERKIARIFIFHCSFVFKLIKKNFLLLSSSLYKHAELCHLTFMGCNAQDSGKVQRGLMYSSQ